MLFVATLTSSPSESPQHAVPILPKTHRSTEREPSAYRGRISSLQRSSVPRASALCAWHTPRHFEPSQMLSDSYRWYERAPPPRVWGQPSAK